MQRLDACGEAGPVFAGPGHPLCTAEQVWPIQSQEGQQVGKHTHCGVVVV